MQNFLWQYVCGYIVVLLWSIFVENIYILLFFQNIYEHYQNFFLAVLIFIVPT